MQGTAKVNVSDIVTLSEKNADLRIANSDLKVQLTEVKVELKQLKEQDEQTRPVKVITKSSRPGPWGSDIENASVQYINLDGIQAEIKESFEKKYKGELQDLNAVKHQVKMLEQELELKGDEFDSFTNTETKRFKIKADNLETSFKEKTNKKDQELIDLREELQKERDNKSDKELEDKRIEEIKTLKKRIKTLEEEVKLLANLGFINRTWRKLTNHVALKAAQKELKIEEQAANSVAKGTPSRWNPFFPWMV